MTKNEFDRQSYKRLSDIKNNTRRSELIFYKGKRFRKSEISPVGLSVGKNQHSFSGTPKSKKYLSQDYLDYIFSFFAVIQKSDYFNNRP